MLMEIERRIIKYFYFSSDSIAFLFLFLHFDYIEAKMRSIQRFLWIIKQTHEVGYHYIWYHLQKLYSNWLGLMKMRGL